VSVRYLLDTDTVSHLIRHPAGLVEKRIASVGTPSVATSILVVAELRFGMAWRPSHRLMHDMERVLSALTILSFERPADLHYANLRADLETRGTPIGANDMLIAAHALASGAILVTGNVREFSRVRGLLVEDWLRSV
jgi:tRNA(fMet)-specific endonuclease VapC